MSQRGRDREVEQRERPKTQPVRPHLGERAKPRVHAVHGRGGITAGHHGVDDGAGAVHRGERAVTDLHPPLVARDRDDRFESQLVITKTKRVSHGGGVSVLAGGSNSSE